MARGLQMQNGDWLVQDRALVLVEKHDKVRRDLNKFLLTEQEYDTNLTSFSRYNPSYGVQLNNIIMYKGLSTTMIIDQMNKNLSASLKWYLNLQESRSNLSYEEIILDMQFFVYVDPDIATKLRFSIELLLQGNKTYSTLGVYSQEVS